MKNSIIKKGLGIVSVAVFAMALFVNTNSVNATNSNISLASLVSLNSAEAEEEGGYHVFWVDRSWGRIKVCLNGGSESC